VGRIRTLKIKPLSVNRAWQGRRFRSKEYKAYQQEIALKLRKMTLPEPPYTLLLEFGVSNKAADYDNPIKPFQDCLQAYYGFNDSQIYEGVQRKIIVPKGEEYIKFSILPLIDLSHLFAIKKGR
jgi:Holliday junction resolvase RusA-like endonuclease